MGRISFLDSSKFLRIKQKFELEVRGCFGEKERASEQNLKRSEEATSNPSFLKIFRFLMLW